MKKLFLAASAAFVLASTPAFAAETVNFMMKADQQSLRDESRKDLFAVGIADRQIETALKLECQAGRTGWIKRSDESCSLAGNGAVLNAGKKLQRTQYAGGWVVKADGYTEGGTMSVGYLALGKAPASANSFGGNMILKPENPSSGALALKESILKKVGMTTGGGLIDERVDTIQLSSFTIPSAGLPSDKGCAWTGNIAFSYQTESWFFDVVANCGGKEFPFKGNMPWTETAGVANQTQYDLTLTLPSAEVSSDDALFANTEGDGDLFAQADGISGQIVMKEGGKVTTKVDGVDTEVAVQIDASGTLTGQNVPIETVRSLATLIGVLSRTFFGA